MKIAITSGYAGSQHAIALVTLLSRAGHEVGLCLNVRAFHPRRIRIYLRQYGAALFSIALRRVIAPGTFARNDAELRHIRAFLRERDVAHRSLTSACRACGARLVHVSDLNCPLALRALERYRPELILYAGGGLLRKTFLDKAAIGVLNAHGGPLPAIRGMNAAEWALFEGMQPGAAVHFIDTEVDTGPVLFFKELAVSPSDTIADIRGKGVVMAVEALLEAVHRIARGDVGAAAQRREDGLQHFMMHPLLVGIVQDWVRAGLTPLAARTGSVP